MVKEDIGRTGLDLLQQGFDFWCALTEVIYKFGLFLNYLFLLHFGANYPGACRERLSARDMLWMKMRGREIQIGILADLGKFAEDDLPIPGSHASIHHQRRAASNNDADIRNKIHTPVRNHIDMVRYSDGFVFLHQRRGLALIVTERGRLLRFACKSGCADESE